MNSRLSHYSDDGRQTVLQAGTARAADPPLNPSIAAECDSAGSSSKIRETVDFAAWWRSEHRAQAR